MELMIFKGTPEEIAAILPSVTSKGAVIVATAGASPDEASSGVVQDERYVSTALARLALRRRKLSPEQLLVLRTLYAAHPETVLANELMEKLNYSRPQFSGLMGAFGRRFSHTPGYVDGTSFFAQEWESESSCYRYGLPDCVREAIRLELSL